MRSRLGFLGHDPLLYRDLSAHDNLCHHARLHGWGEQRVDELLERVGMAARADEPRDHQPRPGDGGGRRDLVLGLRAGGVAFVAPSGDVSADQVGGLYR